MECYKCKGTGFISSFSHVSEGRCFCCNGSGSIPDAKKKNLGYSKAFIGEYLQRGFFPEDQSGMEKIKCIGMEGHLTAEIWILKDADFFYIGQPVCRASLWYKIPLASFPEFLIHYIKAFKLTIS